MGNLSDAEYTGKGIGVCVMDTGLFPHIDFAGRIWVFRDFVRGQKQPYDDNSHGTHVCGIIGGDGTASRGRIRGIAPGCGFIALKVLDGLGNGHEKNVNTIRNINRNIDIKVCAGGNINRLEDIKKLLFAGCLQVILNA